MKVSERQEKRQSTRFCDSQAAFRMNFFSQTNLLTASQQNLAENICRYTTHGIHALFSILHVCRHLYISKKKRTTIIAKQEKREEEDKEKKGKNGRIEQIKMMASFFFCTPISPVILAMHIFARTHTQTQCLLLCR